MPRGRRKKISTDMPHASLSPSIPLLVDFYIIFEGAIDQGSTSRLYQAIQDGVSRNVPKIIIFFSSLGGSIYEGFLLANVIQNSKVPILVHATNHIDSIANVIYLSAKERSAESHAKFYMHGSSSGGGDERALEDSLSAVKTNNSRIAYFISENTSLSLEKVRGMMSIGTTISAQEALQYGITDQVIHREIPDGVNRVEIIYVN